MNSAREKRTLEKKLTSVKTLGDSDEEDEGGAAAWVSKSRTSEQQKKEEVFVVIFKDGCTVHMRKKFTRFVIFV